MSTRNRKPLQRIIDEALTKNQFKLPLFEKLGASSFFGTNEKLRKGTFSRQNFSANCPNGYLIGVGVSSIFTALEAFLKEPQGVVLINIDPKATETAKEFIERLSREEVIYRNKEGEEYSYNAKKDLYTKKHYTQENGTIDVFALFVLYSKILIDLAKNGKMAAVQSDIFDEKFLKTLLEVLPDITNKNNIINLSNVGDWIKRATIQNTDNKLNDDLWRDKFIKFKNLEILKPWKPNVNYYMYTSANSGYFQNVLIDSIPDKPCLYSEINILKNLKNKPIF